MYGGLLKAAGWCHDRIEAACKAMSAAEYAEITKTFPKLSPSLEFRATPEKACIEELRLTVWKITASVYGR